MYVVSLHILEMTTLEIHRQTEHANAHKIKINLLSLKK